MGLPKWFTDGFAVNLPRLRLSNEVEVIEVEVEVVVVVVVVAAAAAIVCCCCCCCCRRCCCCC